MKPAGMETGWSAQQRVLVFTTCVILLFMPAGLYTSRHHAQKSNSRVAVMGMKAIHPIPALMAEAEEKYRKLLAKQSKTLMEAVSEYRRRYGREPPRGFGDWWRFAVENNVTMVDEYDRLMEDLAPFWELPGDEVRRRTVQVGNLPTIDLVRLRDGKAVLMNIEKGHSQDNSRARYFVRLIARIQNKLPDMDFPINALAEGRVLVPWEHRHFPNMTEQNSSVGIEVMIGGNFTGGGWGGTNGGVWEAFRRTCHPESRARRPSFSNPSNARGRSPINYSDPTVFVPEPGDDFHIAKTLDDKFDFCSDPSAHLNQGHFFSNWRAIPALYPLFSYSYGWDSINRVVKEFDDMEISWQQKSNMVFWRGSATGGGSTPAGFSPTYHRHRFVRLTSDHSDTRKAIILSDPPNSTSYQQVNVPIAKLNDDIMDVAFVEASHSFDFYPGGEAAMRKAHRFTEHVPLGYNWKFKYLVDMDGMGYSARFLAFLASDSAVIKSTVYSEYFSDWLQPWLHYIPLSQRYHEIYNIFSFFSGPTELMLQVANSSALYDDSTVRKAEDADRRLRHIAQAGKEWKNTVGRNIDMEVYVYRLCLEWGRLWADDRDSMNFAMPG